MYTLHSDINKRTGRVRGKIMPRKKRLGDLLLAAGVIRQEDLDKALAVQAGSDRRLGYLLINMDIISEKDLQSVLSEQLGIPIIDIHGTFNKEIKNLLPRYLCKKYNVIPLALADHNLLTIAMVDPSDHEAVTLIERYTGKVLQPCLASHSDIDSAIARYIPWSPRDLFNRQNGWKLTGAAVLLALALTILMVVQYNSDRARARFGTKQVTKTAVLYQHHDLILKFERSGKITLSGHGAHARGSYSITFNSLDSLKQFIKNKRNDLSLEQQKWINWVLGNQTQST